MIRINKYLASLGIASRRKVDDLILQGKISINGVVLKELGTKVDPDKDDIRVNGNSIQEQNDFVYIVLNKPRGVISSASDEHGRQTVVDLVKSTVRIFPVGRLDQESEGLILLTNNGALTNNLTHPKFHISKTYHVLIEGLLSDSQLEKLQTGVILKDGLTAPAEVRVLEAGKKSLIEIVLHEGRNRQIRRMCSELNIQLRNLKRVKIGEVGLGDLALGKFRDLTPEEISSLVSS